MRFFAIEIEAFQPGSVAPTFDLGHGVAPHGALSELAAPVESVGTLLASDMGYRTAPSDPGGPVPYPPLLTQAFAIDNRLNLDPAQSGVAAAWGSAVLANPNQHWDAIAASWNSDGRAVRVRAGVKAWDRERGLWLDPAVATLDLMFAGVATPWFLSDTTLTIPLRDGTYWLERLYQTNLYGGTGGYDGTAVLAGKPIPRTRGGTSAHPVRNITPTLLDPTNLIYQFNDGPGTLEHLYEGGAEVIAFDSNTANLYAGSTPAGKVRTDFSRGLFQLGSSPVHTITADVTGEFPSAGVVTTWAAIARYLLTEDLSLPAGLIDTASFAAADAAYAYVSGLYFGSDNAVTGVDALGAALAGIGARLISPRPGTLGLFTLRAPSVAAMPAAALDKTNLISLTPRPLPAGLDPPPFRFRVGYDTNYTVQTGDLNTASATAAQLQFVGVAANFQSFASTDVLAAYRRPNDPAPLLSPLLDGTDAQTVANDLGALWSTRRRLYDAVVPEAVAGGLDVGVCVRLTFAMDDLPTGRVGQIVGYQFRSEDASTTFQVLV